MDSDSDPFFSVGVSTNFYGRLIEKFLQILNLWRFSFLVFPFSSTILTCCRPQNILDDAQFRLFLRGRRSCQTCYSAVPRDVFKLLQLTSKHYLDKTFLNEIGNHLFTGKGDSILKENFGYFIKCMILYFPNIRNTRNWTLLLGVFRQTFDTETRLIRYVNFTF